MQATRQLAALTNLNEFQNAEAINYLERAMGVGQHHDAVSGTEKQHVANDYTKRLSIGVDKSLNVIQNGLNKIMENDFMVNSSIIFCPMLNISDCSPLDNLESFVAMTYNPLASPIESWIQIPVVSDNYLVFDANNVLVTSETVEIDKETSSIPERNSKARYNLVFNANIQPLKFSTFTVKKSAKKQKFKEIKVSNNPLFIRNEHIQVTFDINGNLNELINIDIGKNTLIKQMFCYYNSYQGNNSEGQFQPSGAYIFRPDSDTPTCLDVKHFSVYNGEQFDEIHQVYNEWISQTVRLYKGAKNAEFNWQVGPIDVEDGQGKEVITRFISDLNSQATFYTDSNGREMLKRVRNFRPTWNLDQTEKVSGNYYPINSRIFIRDEAEKTQLTLVTDRSQGGSSIEDGQIEVMLHRITLNDDSLGVGEPLNEKGIDGKGMIVKGSLNLIYDFVENSARLHRQLAHEINSKPIVLFNTVMNDMKNLMDWNSIGNIELPANLHLLTLMKDYDREEKNILLVRIEHFYEIGEDAVLSRPTSVDLRDLFKDSFNVVGVQELALGANMPVEELDQRLEWQSEAATGGHFSKIDYLKFKNNIFSTKKSLADFTFTFQPMQIRTFYVWFS